MDLIRIEVEETPKWFVWPKRNKESKSSRSGKNVSHGKSISSSDGNSISRPGLLLSRNSSAMPQKITNLTNVNSNRKQNLTGQRMTLAQSESARQYRQRELLYRSITGTELINIPSSEPSSYVMRCHIAARVDNEQRVVGSAPSSSQTFKILSISKKPLESGDDEDFDLTNSVILTCRQSRPQPTVALSHSTKTGDTAVKGVH
ncbi:unnamed protein product [Litomosoides sigmodontis]|uniref:Uncharacterized protein n=1 Tax=Litomosoides sigmodontis TaxID=42156 RepID=A0A3P7JKU1_LITSI|nr:unnamed protein product [Litomosoides sigmodontis]